MDMIFLNIPQSKETCSMRIGISKLSMVCERLFVIVAPDEFAPCPACPLPQVPWDRL